MKHKMRELGTIVEDTTVRIKGMLLACEIDMDFNQQYVFQPKALSSDGKPIEKYLVCYSQIKGPDYHVDLPEHLLGKEVTDKASGYKGTVVSLIVYMNGCFHAVVKAKGFTRDGNIKEPVELDIRRLEGPDIKKMSKKELEESHIKSPSPESMPKRKLSR